MNCPCGQPMLVGVDFLVCSACQQKANGALLLWASLENLSGWQGLPPPIAVKPAGKHKQELHAVYTEQAWKASRYLFTFLHGRSVASSYRQADGTYVVKFTRSDALSEAMQAYQNEPPF